MKFRDLIEIEEMKQLECDIIRLDKQFNRAMKRLSKLKDECETKIERYTYLINNNPIISTEIRRMKLQKLKQNIEKEKDKEVNR